VPVTNDSGTIVIEEGVFSKRVRRPVDVLRFTLAVLGTLGVITLSTILLNTFSAIDQDVADSASRLPAIIALLLGIVTGIGQFVLPFIVAYSLLTRRGGRLLAEAVLSFIVAALLIGVIVSLLRDYGSNDLWFALAGTTEREIFPLQALIASVTALMTVARLRGSASVATSVIVGASAVADNLAGRFTVTSLVASLLFGWAVGLGFRYLFGTPTTRPKGLEVAKTLHAAGIVINVLRATTSTDHGRRYVATTAENDKYHVVVYDRDLEGAGLFPRWWRSLRLRDNDALGGWTMRQAVERSALMAFASEAVAAPTPRLVALRSIGDDASVLVYEWIEDADTSEKVVNDQGLVSAWRALQVLHTASIAHRSISPDHLVFHSDNSVTLLHITSGAVAMSDLQRRIDLADMLISLSLIASPERAIDTAQQVFSSSEIADALPALQVFALSSANRKLLRKQRGLLGHIRELVAAAAPTTTVQSVTLERLQPRKLITLLVAFIAGYILLGQIGNVDIVNLLTTANYNWVGFAIAMTIITYIGSAMALLGFVVEKLSLWRTFLAQWAASFATLISPPALGTVAINGRYLQREGLPATAAGATVAVSQALAFLVHIGLLFVAGYLTGSNQDFTFNPPREVVIAIASAVLVVLAVLPLPKVRRYLVSIARPRISEVVPRFVTLSQQPAKLAVGIGGMFILNLAFCAVLVASVFAFDGNGSIAAISLVYLAGSTLGQVAPTPGGIGAVEAVMTAGLIAIGIDAGIALSSVLLFRLLTFWIPTVPGWFAFQYLLKRGSL
jgi:uncharacterized protein (TIRG00374 family)